MMQKCSTGEYGVT